MAKIKTRNTDNHKTKPKNVDRRTFEKVYWPYIPIVFIITVLISLGVHTGSLQAYVKHPGGRVLNYATSMTISGLLADTNSARSSNGVNTLSLNDKLDAAAQASADDMAARNYWSHYTPEGNPPWVWVNNEGYAYQKLGQNLATGFNDEQSTINGWMASPPHRENLLDPSFTQVGFGFANNPNYTSAGGGPMTIIVAFYGQPQVLSASTSTPSSSVKSSTTPAASLPTPAPAPTPETVSPSPVPTPATAPAVNQQIAKKQPATTETPQASVTPSVKSSRIQLAIGNSTTTNLITTLLIVSALLIGVLWARRHLFAIHRFLVKGESYAVRHPLTDIGLLIIACLLFIISQTAGLTQ